MMTLFRSPRTAIHFVTVLEEMPVQETADGIAQVRGAGLPVGGVVVNLVRPRDLRVKDLAAARKGVLDRSAIRADLVSAGVDVADDLVAKLVRRHPHVFGDEDAKDSGEVLARWEELKAKEKVGRGVLDGVPRAMPALLRAQRVGEKAAHIGLDWPDAQGPRDKLSEEIRELDEAIAQGDEHAMQSELGDVLFALVSVARKHGLDAEAALRGTLDRFSARTERVEGLLRERALDPKRLPATELDALWREAKEALSRASI